MHGDKFRMTTNAAYIRGDILNLNEELNTLLVEEVSGIAEVKHCLIQFAIDGKSKYALNPFY